MPEQQLIDRVQAAQTIQLDIPSRTPKAENWAPHTLKPSVLLTRVNLAPNAFKFPRKKPQPGETPLTLKLRERIGHIRHVDVYYVAGEQPRQPRLIAKIVDLSMFAPGFAPSRPSVEKWFSHEINIFNELQPLQGRIVPRLAGVFGNGMLYCAVYEDAGRPLTLKEKYEDEKTCDDILAAVREINAAGVAVYPQWSHVRIIDGRITITAFDNAATLQTYTPARLKELAEVHESFVNLTPQQHLEGALEQSMDMTKSLMHRPYYDSDSEDED